MYEIKATIFYIDNTSAGPYGIPTQVIKNAWLMYKEEITQLNESCLEKG